MKILLTCSKNTRNREIGSKKSFRKKYFSKYVFKNGKRYIKCDGLDQKLTKNSLKLLKYWEIVEYLGVKIWFPNFLLKVCFLDVSGDCKKQLFGIPNFYFWKIFFFWPIIFLKCQSLSIFLQMICSTFGHINIIFCTYEIIPFQFFWNLKKISTHFFKKWKWIFFSKMKIFILINNFFQILVQICHACMSFGYILFVLLYLFFIPL